ETDRVILDTSALRGGVAARSRKHREASLVRADGVVFNLLKILWNLITTPSAPKRRLRDILLRSRPPVPRRGGENCGTLRFGSSHFRVGVIFFVQLPAPPTNVRSSCCSASPIHSRTRPARLDDISSAVLPLALRRKFFSLSSPNS